MIVDELIEIKVSMKTLEHYKSKGYNAIPGEFLLIKTKDLTIGSHKKVKCKCDYCGEEKYVIFKNYIIFTKINGKYCCNNQKCVNQKIKDVCNIKYGVDNPFQDESIKEKIKETLLNRYNVEHPMYLDKTKEKIKKTCLDKYGVEHPMHLEETKEKIRKTCLDKYGVDHLSKSPEYKKKIKEKKIKEGKRLPDEMIDPFILYRKNVDNITETFRKQLFQEWNGYDYYDSEYIKDNLTINNSYPSIDHKISVYYGFVNKIPEKTIGSIDNLCITKISNNCKKWNTCETEFLEKIKKDTQI